MDTASSIGVLILAVLVFANFISLLNYWCDTVPKIDEMHARLTLGNKWYDDNVVYRRPRPDKPTIIEAEIIKEVLPSTVAIRSQNSKANSQKRNNNHPKVFFLPSPDSYKEFVDDRPPWED